MKNRLNLVLALITSALCIVALSLLPGCLTGQQAAAAGVYASGSAFAEHALDQNGALIVPLEDVAAKLPKLNSGELKPFDFGVLSGELTQLRLKTVSLETADPANRDKYATFDAFLGSVIQSVASVNGGNVPTVGSAVATAALTQASTGIKDGIAHWQGRQSVINPGK